MILEGEVAKLDAGRTGSEGEAGRASKVASQNMKVESVSQKKKANMMRLNDELVGLRASMSEQVMKSCITTLDALMNEQARVVAGPEEKGNRGGILPMSVVACMQSKCKASRSSMESVHCVIELLVIRNKVGVNVSVSSENEGHMCDARNEPVAPTVVKEENTVSVVKGGEGHHARGDLLLVAIQPKLGITLCEERENDKRENAASSCESRRKALRAGVSEAEAVDVHRERS